MLESIRKRRNSFIILLAFAAIIIVFIFWGAGPSGDNGDRTTAAVVDGESITVKDYSALYKRELEYYKNTFKDQFTDDVARKLDLKNRTLDILINRALALKAARSKGVEASEKEIQDAIKSFPVFLKDGAFDKETYFSVLKANRVSPAEFERSIEQDILTAKVRETVVKDVKVTDEEAKEVFMRENRKIDLEYVSLDAGRFKEAVRVSDEEAMEYLRKNGSAFMVPVRMKAAYAYVSYKDQFDKARPKVSDKEIKEYYEKNQKEFSTPPAIKARHILVRPDAKAGNMEKAKTEARDKLEGILKKVKAGESFAVLASAHSQDPGSAKAGGDLGWFKPGVMIKPFEEAAFALKKGEVSGVVETEFGFHIILLEDRKEPGVVPLKGAADAIKTAIAIERSKASAKELASALERPFMDARNVEEMKKAAAQKNAKFAVTDYFTESDKRFEILKNEMLRDVVLSLRAAEVSGAVETNDGVYMIKAVEKIDAHVPDYKDVSAKVKAVVIAEKADEAAQKKAKEILDKVKGGADLAAIARTEKLAISRTGLFSKAQGFIPKIGAFAADKEALFELTPSSPNYPEVFAHNRKHHVLKLASTKEADEKGFEQVRQMISQRLLARKQEDALNVWLKDLRAKAKIKVYEDVL